MKRTGKKFLAWALTLSMACSLCAPVAMAEPMVTSPAPLISSYSPYSDIKGHWAEDAITRWSEYNVVAGFGSEFKPDGVLTRAQMATILSNLLGLTKESEKNPFKDVAGDAWYKTYILRCYEAGVMSGDGVNANPETLVTRQEAMTMLCKALGIAPIQGDDLSAFADGEATASWAVPYVAAMVKAGYVGGVGDGKLAPVGEMTRAASMTVLNNAVVQYINEAGEYTLTNEEGIILVASGDVTLTGETKASILVTHAADGKTVKFNKATVTGTVTVQADNATITNSLSNLPELQLKGEGSKVKLDRPDNGGSSGSSSSGSNRPDSGGSGGGSTKPEETPKNVLTISEDGKEITSGTYDTITITDAVGDGEVMLSNVTINGDLTIRGGGSNSIKLDNCTIHGKIIMDKPKEKGEPPRLELTNTPVPKVETKGPAIVEAKDVHSGITEMDAKAPVTIQGEKTQIEAMTAQANVEVKGGKINKIVVSKDAKTPVHVAVAEEAKLGELEVNAPASIDAKGSVNEVTAKADVEVKGGKVDRVTIPKDSKPVHVKVDEKAAVSDVNINTSGVTITNDGMVEVLSTELENVPEVEKKGNKKDEIPENIVKHNWGGKWTYLDDTYHQKVCSDGQHTRQELHHWTKGKVIKQPTATEDGLMEYKCGTCDSKKQEIIPAKMSSEDKLLSRAQKAGLLKYFDKVDMGGVNRLEVVKLIAAYKGWDVSKHIKPDATDSGHLTAEEQTIIALACDNGFMARYDTDEFKPENIVTRAEMAVILCKLIYGVDVNPNQFEVNDYFTDIPAWAVGYISQCASLKLFAPEANNGKFCPNDNVSMTSALNWLLNAKAWEENNPVSNDQYLWVKDSDEELNDWIAKIILSDGTAAKVDMNTVVQNAPAAFSSAEGNEVIEWLNNGHEHSNIDERIWKYSTNERGTYTLAYVDSVYDAATRYNIGNDKAYVDGIGDVEEFLVDKQTIFVDIKGGKSYIGYQNVPDYTKAELAYVLDNTVAEVVFVLDYAEEMMGTYFILSSEKRESLKYDSKFYYEYVDAYINGEKVALTVSYDALSKDELLLQAGVLYKVTGTVDKEYITAVEIVEMDADYVGTLHSVSDHAFRLRNESENILKFDTNDDTVFVMVEAVYDQNGSFKKWSISDANISDFSNIMNMTGYSVVVVQTAEQTAELVYVFIYQGEIVEKKDTYFILTEADHDSLKYNGDYYREYFDAYVDGQKTTLYVAYDALGVDKSLDVNVLYKITEINGDYVTGVKALGSLKNTDFAVVRVDKQREDGNLMYRNRQLQAFNQTEQVTSSGSWIIDQDTLLVYVDFEHQYVRSARGNQVTRHPELKSDYMTVVTADGNRAKLIYIAESVCNGECGTIYYYSGIYNVNHDTDIYRITYTLYMNTTGKKVQITEPTKYSDEKQVEQALVGKTEGFYQVKNKKLKSVFTVGENGTHGQIGNVYYVAGDTAVYDVQTNELHTKRNSGVAEITDQAVFTDLLGGNLDSYQKVVDAVKSGIQVHLAYVVEMKENWDDNLVKRVFITSYY